MANNNSSSSNNNNNNSFIYESASLQYNGQ
jgi:hypothetical protein